VDDGSRNPAPLLDSGCHRATHSVPHIVLPRPFHRLRLQI